MDRGIELAQSFWKMLWEDAGLAPLHRLDLNLLRFRYPDGDDERSCAPAGRSAQAVRPG